MFNFKLNPAKPVKFNAKGIQAAIDRDGGVMADIKYDSIRCLLVVDRDEHGVAQVTAMSRSDKRIPALVQLFTSEEDRKALTQLLDESLYPTGLVIDGEVMVKGVTFQQGSGMLRRKTPIAVQELEYKMYGLLPLEHFIQHDSKTPYQVSTCVMQAQMNVFLHQVRELLPAMQWDQAISYEVYNMEGLEELYKQVRDAGNEGLVIKAMFQPWHRGKKVGWWKMKPEDTVDGQVVGILWGTEGKANEGKVIGFEVELESGVVVNVDGLTDAQKAEYTAEVFRLCIDQMLDVDSRADYIAASVQSCVTNPYHNWYIEVTFMEYTDDGSLRHPKFGKWRGLEDSPTVKS